MKIPDRADVCVFSNGSVPMTSFYTSLDLTSRNTTHQLPLSLFHPTVATETPLPDTQPEFQMIQNTHQELFAAQSKGDHSYSRFVQGDFPPPVMAPETAFKNIKLDSLKDVGDTVGVNGFNGGYHEHSTGGDGPKKRPLCVEPGALPQETANIKRRKRQPNRQKPNKRATNNDDDSDGSDDDGIDPDGHEAGNQDMPFFVCPYARRYPTKHKSCWNKTLHNMNRVRQHIIRYHAHCCEVCKVCFKSKKKLTKHQMQNEQHTFGQCKLRPEWPGYMEGPESELAGQIRASRRGQSTADQYSELYSLIFGSEHQVNKIPYCCPHPPLIEAFVQYLLINLPQPSSSLLRLENLQESAHTQALLQRILEALDTTDRANTRSQGSTQQMPALSELEAPGPFPEAGTGIPGLEFHNGFAPIFGTTHHHDLVGSTNLGHGILPSTPALGQASATGEAYLSPIDGQVSNGVEIPSMFSVVEQNEVGESDFNSYLFLSSVSQEDTDADFQGNDLAWSAAQ